MASHAASVACAELGAAPADLRAAPVVASAIADTLMIPPQYHDTLRIEHAFVVTGGCQADVAGFLMPYVLLKSGLRVGVSETGNFSPVQAGVALSYSTDLEGAPPPWNMGNFIMARRFDSRRSQGGIVEYFVGLWRDSKRSTVGIFSRSSKRTLSTPVVLFSSELPIRSVNYFPAVDTSAGNLGLTQEAGNELRLINLSWSHSALPN